MHKAKDRKGIGESEGGRRLKILRGSKGEGVKPDLRGGPTRREKEPDGKNHVLEVRDWLNREGV